MSGPAAPPPVLATVRTRMYQVGFGDCFLVSFEYAGQADAGSCSAATRRSRTGSTP
jgi:hypothetical protein